MCHLFPRHHPIQEDFCQLLTYRGYSMVHTKRGKNFNPCYLPPPPHPHPQLQLHVSFRVGKNAPIYYSVKTDDLALFHVGGGWTGGGEHKFKMWKIYFTPILFMLFKG